MTSVTFLLLVMRGTEMKINSCFRQLPPQIYKEDKKATQ